MPATVSEVSSFSLMCACAEVLNMNIESDTNAAVTAYVIEELGLLTSSRTRLFKNESIKSLILNTTTPCGYGEKNQFLILFQWLSILYLWTISPTKNK